MTKSKNTKTQAEYAKMSRIYICNENMRALNIIKAAEELSSIDNTISFIMEKHFKNEIIEVKK